MGGPALACASDHGIIVTDHPENRSVARWQPASRGRANLSWALMRIYAELVRRQWQSIASDYNFGISNF